MCAFLINPYIYAVGGGGDTTPWYDSSWNYRLKVTVNSAEVSGTTTNFPLALDLSLLPAGFHTNVKDAGADIRITKADGTTEVPREIVTYIASADTGEIHFKGDISSSADTSFYIYYGNSGATDYAETDTYGRNNVWNSGSFQYVGHLQSSPADSTSNGRSTNTVGTPTYGPGNLGLGNAYIGSGTSSSNYTNLASNSFLDITQNVTYSAWIYFDGSTNTTTKYILSRQQNTAVRIVNAWTLQQNSQKLYVSYRFDANGTVYNNISNSNMPSGWTLVHAVRNGTNAKLYFNGLQESSITLAAGNGTASTTTPLAIGYYTSDNTYSNFEYKGNINELRIRNTSITDTAVLRNEYNNVGRMNQFYSLGSQQAKP
jgi:hypothetical protein